MLILSANLCIRFYSFQCNHGDIDWSFASFDCSVTEMRVIDVLPDSDAARKGVRVGDALVAVDLKAAQVLYLHIWTNT